MSFIVLFAKYSLMMISLKIPMICSKNHYPNIATLCFLFLLGIPTGLRAGHTGQIKGVVPLPKSKAPSAPAKKYFGKISGKVVTAPAPIAGVWLENSSLSSPKAPADVTMGQNNYQFSSFLIIVPKNTRVFFPNKDSDYHNIYSLSRTKKFDLGRYKKDENPAPSVLFNKPGFVALRCEIHDHMRANIVVVNSPYYMVTDSKGAFTFKNIPPGNYTLHAQIDLKTTWKTSVQVRKDKTSPVIFLTK